MADGLVQAPLAIPRVAANADPATARAMLEEWGVLVIEGAVTSDDLRIIERDLAPWFDQTPLGEGLFLGRKTRRFSGMFAKAPSTAQLAVHPLVTAIVEPLLQGPSRSRCDVMQLNLTQAIAIDPGQGGQPMHRDDSMFPFPHDFELIVNAMWPLDEFTPENGGTRIAPKSHRWQRERRPQEHETVSVSAPAGSVVLWLGSTLHGGGANQTSAARRGVVFNYCLGWLGQAEKLLLTTPPDVARTLPEKLQRLLGYQVHRPSLGWIEERDPIEWLRGDISALASAQDHFTPDLQARLEAAFAEGNQSDAEQRDRKAQ